MTPGSNLLLRASRLIGFTKVQYLKDLGRVTNEIGLDVTTYAAPVDIMGSLQAVPRSVYQAYGLDFQKNYLMFYTTTDVIDLARDVSGDMLQYGGKKYQLVSETDWMQIDGWTGVLCVQVT